MPVYIGDGTGGPPVNISTFVRNAEGGAKGPTPLLGTSGKRVLIARHETGVQPIDLTGSSTVAWGLTSCASVVYASTDPRAPPIAYVHHANIGHVSADDVAKALATLGGEPFRVLVVFAYPNVRDKLYTESIGTIVAKGVPRRHVIEFPNLMTGSFGINARGQIGC